MSLKRSAFCVFKSSRDKSKIEPEKHGSPSKRIKMSSTSDILGERGQSSHGNSVSSTPPPKKLAMKPPMNPSRSEPRTRKSICKQQKKDTQHALPIKSISSKENKPHKSGLRHRIKPYMHEKKDLITLSQQLKPDASLEEIFLPDVQKPIMDFNDETENINIHTRCKVAPKTDDADRMGDFTENDPSDVPILNEANFECLTDKTIERTSSVKLRSEVNMLETSNETARKRYSLDSNIPTLQREELTVVENSDPPSSIAAVMMTNMDEEMLNSSKRLFEWLIGPINTNKFFSDVWEKKPLFIKRRQPMYNDGWFSTKEFENILRQHHLQFTKNIDIAVYKDGKRSTLNANGRVYAPNVWKHYQDGWSIRLLNPQTYSRNIWKFCSKLQEYFGCFVGTNVYLTPPSSQGFAPHFDDIEAFVIQLEGKKRWRLYNSRSLSEVLPRYSSENISPNELGEPILDRVLEPGDTMYMPRGTIHQAVTDQGEHSLHITLSVYQRSCWADYLDKLIPAALSLAAEEDADFRKGLPVGYLNQVGLLHSQEMTPMRSAFLKTVEHLMKKLVAYLPVDGAADQMAVDAIEEQLPPVLSEVESKCSVLGNEEVSCEGGNIKGNAELKEETEVRLIRPGVARLIYEEDQAVIYHSMENSRVFKEYPMQALKLSPEEACAAELLLATFPNYIYVSSLPMESVEEKVALASRLYGSGLLRTKHPLS